MSSFTGFSNTQVQLERVVVTGSKIDYYDSPAITLIKPADFLIQKVRIVNDSREKSQREDEIYKTVRNLLKSANKNTNIEIGVGNEIIYPISLKNMQLDFYSEERKDTSVVNLFIKTPINQKLNIESLVKNISTFISDSKVIGRSEISKQGELVLSIKNPSKYRGELLTLIAKDLEKTLAIFENNFKAEISGLSQAIQWERASVSELRLYLEYDYTLISK